MRAVLIFCEGNHDIVYVTRSLGTIAGARWVGDPIKDLPPPFGPVTDSTNPTDPIVESYIVQRYKSRVIGDLKLAGAAHAPTPTFDTILKSQDGNTLYCLLRCNGDQAATATLALLEDLKILLPVVAGRPNTITNVAQAFLFDADSTGRIERQNTFNKDYTTCLDRNLLEHSQWLNGSYGPTGLFVFHDKATGIGTLESQLAPYFESQWPRRWEEAGTYLTNNQSENDPVARKPAERLKAQMTITGQFKCPGDPLTQSLKKPRRGPPVLKDDHFRGDASQELVSFLQNIPW